MIEVEYKGTTIEMIHGDNLIKVINHKVDEMIRKGWQIKVDPIEVIEDIEDDSQGGIDNGSA